jgi:hypothetical protein
MRYLGIVVLTALVTCFLTAAWDVHDNNRFFHVECQSPYGAATYGPYWMIRNDRVGSLANQFCADATPMVSFTEQGKQE